MLIEDINNSIGWELPKFAWDRLHTLRCYHVKELCDKHDSMKMVRIYA